MERHLRHPQAQEYPTLDTMVAAVEAQNDAHIAEATHKLQQELSVLETKAAAIRALLETGQVLTKPNSEPSSAEKAREQAAKDQTLALLETLPIDDNEDIHLEYTAERDFEFDRHSLVKVTHDVHKRAGGYYIATTKTGDKGSYVSGTAQKHTSRKRYIVHPELRRPLQAKDARSFDPKTFKEGSWDSCEDWTRTITQAVRSSKLVDTLLGLLGDPDDPFVMVDKKDHQTVYKRTFQAGDTALSITACYPVTRPDEPSIVYSIGLSRSKEGVIAQRADIEVSNYTLNGTPLGTIKYDEEYAVTRSMVKPLIEEVL